MGQQVVYQHRCTPTNVDDAGVARQASVRDIGYRLGAADAVPQVFVEF